MKNADRVKEIFNNGSKNYTIVQINKDYSIDIVYANPKYNVTQNIGFYEWFHNEEKYHVLQTFFKSSFYAHKEIVSAFYRKCMFKQPEEIIDYLADRRKP